VVIAGAAPRAGGLTNREVRKAIATIPDPELPVITIGDLGMIHRVRVSDDSILVRILPTFVGCPAIELISNAIRDRLAPFGRPVDVGTTFEVPWTSDRISRRGRRSLEAAGIAPPSDPALVRCPWCASARVAMDSAFGPTQCRALYYCRDCRQPFEALKSV